MAYYFFSSVEQQCGLVRLPLKSKTLNEKKGDETLALRCCRHCAQSWQSKQKEILVSSATTHALQRA